MMSFKVLYLLSFCCNLVQASQVVETCTTRIKESTDTFPIHIPDQGDGCAISTLTVAISDPIEDVNVVLTLDHTFVGDLDITLESPQGTVVGLLERPGGECDSGSFVNDVVTFDDETGDDPESFDPNVNTRPFVIASFGQSSADRDPDFDPVATATLSDLAGEDPAGTWTLRVCDTEKLDIGTVGSFAVEIETCTEEITDQPSSSPSTSPSTSPSDTPTVYELYEPNDHYFTLCRDNPCEADPWIVPVDYNGNGLAGTLPAGYDRAISQIHCPPGYYIEMFAWRWGFANNSPSWVFSGYRNSPRLYNMWPQGANNKARSFRIGHLPLTGGVKLCSNPYNCNNGASEFRYVGSYTPLPGNLTINGGVRRLGLSPGYSIELFRETRYGGESLLITNNTSGWMNVRLDTSYPEWAEWDDEQVVNSFIIRPPEPSN